jgi:hypothetical protein
MTETLDERLERVAGAFRASAEIYRQMGTPLYAELCKGVVEDRELLDLADRGAEGAKPSHFFSAVHYLLLGDPSDPLARRFATLSDEPLEPDGAFPEFARFAREHRAQLRELLETRSVQTTYAERCRAILPPMCEVAREAGEPLNLIEIGCSAGVLLVFDKFAYRLNKQGLVGPEDAPLLLEGELRDGPELFIPRIGKRTGIDLHTIDVRSEEERRWLLSLCFPELREEQARLARALDVIAETEITLLEGDGLTHIRTALASTPDPLCVYHSACLRYWPVESRAALEDILLEESRRRTFWRISIEPSDAFDEWYTGRSAEGPDRSRATGPTGEIAIFRYTAGAAERRVVGRPNADYGVVQWCG